jgi:hypothetical protein
LGTDIDKYNYLISSSTIKIEKPHDEIWICYGGGLGNSYDFENILNTFNKLIRNYNFNIKLIFIGGGPKAEFINSFIKKNNLPSYVTGYLPYSDFLKYLSVCDIALNSFKQNTKVVHSYKFNDYIISGLAILNNLKGETSSFVEKYKIGINFDYDNNKLLDALLHLLNNPLDITSMKNNSLYVANNILNTKIIYKDMILYLEK